MPVTKIDIGAKPNDGTGDSLRDAFGKVNDNLDVLASLVAAKLREQTGFAPLRHDHADSVPRIVADGPPDSAPTVYGAMWIDTAAAKIYLATGTGAPSDWREIAFVS